MFLRLRTSPVLDPQSDNCFVKATSKLPLLKGISRSTLRETAKDISVGVTLKQNLRFGFCRSGSSYMKFRSQVTRGVKTKEGNPRQAGGLEPMGLGYEALRFTTKPVGKLKGPTCGWRKSISHHLTQTLMTRLPCKYQQTIVPHGFQVVRNGFRPSTEWL